MVVSSVDITTKISPVSVDITTMGLVDNTGVTYETADDCGTVTVNVPNLDVSVEYTGKVFTYTGQKNILASFNMDGTTGAITFVPPTDNVFVVQLISAETGLMVDMPIFVTCRANKCFDLLNNRDADKIIAGQDTCEKEWELLYAVIRTALASFRTGEYDQAVRLLALSAELCEKCNCDCGC